MDGSGTPRFQPPPQPGASPYVPSPYAAAAALGPGPGARRPVRVLDGVRFAFTNPNWKNDLLLSIVLSLIPLVGPLAFAGWLVEVHQRLVRRHPSPFPKLDFGDLMYWVNRGLAPFLVGLVVGLPVFFLVYLAIAIGMGITVAIGAATGEPIVVVLVSVVMALAWALFLLAVGPVYNAFQTRAELTGTFEGAFRFSDSMAYARATAWRVIVKNLVFGMVATGLVLCGMLACYVGLFPAIVVVQIAAMHLRWQLYDDHRARGGAEIPLQEPQPVPAEQALAGGGAPRA
ncbi:MAG: DUF4013 domain-containing protein [Polyangiaceae bacterium]|nr:DUF4013 domain-containing protein [Polyangiaceae bacterium]